MGLINMNAYPRTAAGKNENRRLRADGRTPAIIYGNTRTEAKSLELDTRDLIKAMQSGGMNTLLNLTVEGEGDGCVALLRDVQQHPVSDVVFHVDLLEIPLGVPMQVEVGVSFVGENRLVRGGDAVLDVARRSVEIECLPRNMPEGIEVDISELEIGDRVAVSDISLEKAEILTDPEETLVKLNLNTITLIEDEVAEGEEGEEGEEGAEGAEGDEAAAEGDDAPAEGDE